MKAEKPRKDIKDGVKGDKALLKVTFSKEAETGDNYFGG